MKKSNGRLNASDCPFSGTSSTHAKGNPPSPNKKAAKVGPNIDNSLLTDQDDDALDFLNWKELPQDVHDRMKACKHKLTAQTSSSLIRFKNDLTVEMGANRENPTEGMEFHCVSTNLQENLHLQIRLQTQPLALCQGTAQDLVNAISKDGER